MVKGTFSVKSTLNPPIGEAAIGHMSFHKQFEGALEAESVVEMLTVSGNMNGSAAYVAIERVTGRLQGKAGTFWLHHVGIMKRGEPSLSVQVVPDSASGELEGLSGSMKIDILEGKHFYTFDFAINT